MEKLKSILFLLLLAQLGQSKELGQSTPSRLMVISANESPTFIANSAESEDPWSDDCLCAHAVNSDGYGGIYRTYNGTQNGKKWCYVKKSTCKSIITASYELKKLDQNAKDYGLSHVQHPNSFDVGYLGDYAVKVESQKEGCECVGGFNRFFNGSWYKPWPNSSAGKPWCYVETSKCKLLENEDVVIESSSIDEIYFNDYDSDKNTDGTKYSVKIATNEVDTNCLCIGYENFYGYGSSYRIWPGTPANTPWCYIDYSYCIPNANQDFTIHDSNAKMYQSEGTLYREDTGSNYGYKVAKSRQDVSSTLELVQGSNKEEKVISHEIGNLYKNDKPNGYKLEKSSNVRSHRRT